MMRFRAHFAKSNVIAEFTCIIRWTVQPNDSIQIIYSSAKFKHNSFKHTRDTHTRRSCVNGLFKDQLKRCTNLRLLVFWSFPRSCFVERNSRTLVVRVHNSNYLDPRYSATGIFIVRAPFVFTGRPTRTHNTLAYNRDQKAFVNNFRSVLTHNKSIPEPHTYSSVREFFFS